jgi:hypothetical protein
MLRNVDDEVRDMIEESCSMYFSDGKSTDSKVPVQKHKFEEWWQEGRVD